MSLEKKHRGALYEAQGYEHIIDRAFYDGEEDEKRKWIAEKSGEGYVLDGIVFSWSARHNFTKEFVSMGMPFDNGGEGI